jgi:predicted ATP-dependent protease
MPEPAAVRELTASEVTVQIEPASLGFETSDELEPLEGIVGQPRAQKSLDLGLGVRHPNYHVYVAGLTGTDRLNLIRRAIQERLDGGTVPPDTMFVNNFDEPDRPIALRLPAGQGSRLKHDVAEMIDYLREALPRAFREEDFGQEKERLRRQYREKGEKVLEELGELAGEHGMAVEQLPNGQILFIPLKEGRPMTPAEIEQLSPEEMEQIESHQDELFQMAAKTIQQQQEMQRRLSTDVHEVARRFADKLLGPLVERIKQSYDDRVVNGVERNAPQQQFDQAPSKLHRWLDGLKAHIVEHMDRFRELGEVPPHLAAKLLDEQGLDPEERFVEYKVNLVIDNGQLKSSPIVIEEAPNYRNLFGTIERIVDRSGRVITNFTRIKSGSLLEANGGYLIVNLMDALMEPFVWKQLKQTLKRGSLEIDVYDPFSLFTVSGLKPEPVPLDVRLVAVGEPLIYHLLYLYDEDFREIFRVKADFDEELEIDGQAGKLYGRFVRRLSLTEGIKPFDASGVAELVRIGARLAAHQRKVSSLFSHIADVAREADYWAGRSNAHRVSASHVTQAVRERVFRSDLVAEKIRDSIHEGQLLIDMSGSAVGQINGLAVANLGDYAFGRPARVTASVGVGAAGLVNIERESRLSGRTFDKGLLILEGYLRSKYAGERPLALSASLAMEQSYGGIDGDSASAAELLCLLSAIANVPLRQDIAITGSINQRGQIQAIGGVNEKIEGFFDVCSLQGLSGAQGVCIPESNVQNLILRPDVAEAIAQGKFHVWPVAEIDDAILLFTNTRGGEVGNPDSFHGKVAARLKQMLDALKDRAPIAANRVLWTPTGPSDLPSDPRPPLPGEEG